MKVSELLEILERCSPDAEINAPVLCDLVDGTKLNDGCCWLMRVKFVPLVTAAEADSGAKASSLSVEVEVVSGWDGAADPD